MSVTMKVTGGRELERKLAQLPQGTAKGVARRAMKKELAPVADMANALWPGSADDVFRVTSALARSQPRPKMGRSILNMFVGAPGGRFGTPEAHLLEFGTGPRFHKKGRYTGAVSPTPMLQPAWDAHKHRILRGLGERLWDEISKTMARRAAAAARSAGGG